ncbi:MAG: heme o synthase [Haliscomenobacter sp.]
MQDVKAKEKGFVHSVWQAVLDFKLLVKFRLSLTVVFSSLLGFLIAANGPMDWYAFGVLALGGFLVTGAANALNQVLEKEYDRLMQRTANRPLAAGRMRVADAVLIAGMMSLAGISLLALFNPWTAFLGMAALLMYAFVYTPLKRIGPIAVFVGAFPGALPTLIGAAAAEGSITALGVSLFAIQFFWQFPHFWSIGWLGYEDYTRAGYRLLPGRFGVRDNETGLQAFLYAIPLIFLSLLPYAVGASGLISAGCIVLMSVFYAVLGWNLYRRNNRRAALQLMFFSFFYIPVVLIALWMDKI